MNITALIKHTAYTALLLMFFSCTSTLYVAPKQVDCTGAADQKCYLIRKSPEGNWIMHYQEIVGLDYEPGFSYKLKVKKENIKDNPMDGASFSYRLIEEIERKDVAESIAVDDLLDKEWKLEYLKWKGNKFGVEGQSPSLHFKRDGKVNGNGGCNNFFSTFTLDGRTIHLDEIGSTKMMCGEKMELEDAYFQFLAREFRAIFTDGKLVLSSDGGNTMIFTYK